MALAGGDAITRMVAHTRRHSPPARTARHTRAAIRALTRFTVCALFRVHYEVHKPEPHVLLFRRPLGTDPRTGHIVGKENRGDAQNTQQQHSNDNMQDAQ